MSRLSTIDSSFLRIESESAHMHVGWQSILELPAGADRFDGVELTQRIAGRLHLLPRFRQRVTPVPFGVGEPVWRDDPTFDLHNHVHELPPTFVRLGLRRCTNAFFSQPLRRDRPLWEIALIPRLTDGRAAILGKIHHAMVDGVAAVELGMLMFDASADAEAGRLPCRGCRRPRNPGRESCSTRWPTPRWRRFGPPRGWLVSHGRRGTGRGQPRGRPRGVVNRAGRAAPGAGVAPER